MKTRNSSLEINDAAATSAKSLASQLDGEARLSCVFCRAVIVDNHWFGRLPQNGNGGAHAEDVSVLLCSPRCALQHFRTLRLGDNGILPDDERYDRTLEFLLDRKALE